MLTSHIESHQDDEDGAVRYWWAMRRDGDPVAFGDKDWETEKEARADLWRFVYEMGEGVPAPEAVETAT